MNRKKSRAFAARRWKREVRSLLIFALVMFSIRSSLADWNPVPSGSMEPTILVSDRVLVNKFAYDLKVPFTTWHIAEWGNPQQNHKNINLTSGPNFGVHFYLYQMQEQGNSIKGIKPRVKL